MVLFIISAGLSIRPTLSVPPHFHKSLLYIRISILSLKISMSVLFFFGTSLVAQMVKSLPAMQETQVRSPSREGPLDKGMATHSSTLAWRIQWMEKPGGLQSMGVTKSRTQLSD